jgi:hypothetical protein
MSDLGPNHHYWKEHPPSEPVIPSRIIFKVNGETRYDNNFNEPKVEVRTTWERDIHTHPIDIPLPAEIRSVTYTIEVTEL